MFVLRLQKSKIKLTASQGLTLQVAPDEPLVSSLEFEVGQNVPFTSTRTKLRVLADMLSKDHQVYNSRLIFAPILHQASNTYSSILL